MIVLRKSWNTSCCYNERIHMYFNFNSISLSFSSLYFMVTEDKETIYDIDGEQDKGDAVHPAGTDQ
jgi:hypothetical protein